MGCDGGTIPKRHELVKTAKRPEQKDKDMARKAKWSTCSITQQSLVEPIVACELGNLYNKESILEFLLDRTICETASHIRNLKDVKTLKLTPNSGFDKETCGTAQEYYDTQAAMFVCPVVGLEMNGKYKFVLLWSCGCVLSERALKEVETDVCHNCGTKFEKDDIVILNAEEEDLTRMEGNMETRREKLKALKKEKKEKKAGKRKSDAQKLPEIDADGFSIPKSIDHLKKKVKTDAAQENGVAKNGKGRDISGHIKKAGTNGETSKGKHKKQPEQIDVKKSKVYKSLFTSSESSKNRGKDQNAHWITYNPYHL